ncbi:MAG: hypothetical protein R3284_05385, partial [Rubricoccaceae bacterium]|nr:hypothetical protein [Rubricoccaceae bacterium]
MKNRLLIVFLIVGTAPAFAQTPIVPSLGPDLFETQETAFVEGDQPEIQQRSGGAAFGLSLILPGLGHRYASGSWGTMATIHGLADAALWVGLADAYVQIGRAETAFETLASTSAGVDGSGRSRGFYL